MKLHTRDLAETKMEIEVTRNTRISEKKNAVINAATELIDK
jgi:hypothetical protein